MQATTIRLSIDQHCNIYLNISVVFLNESPTCTNPNDGPTKCMTISAHYGTIMIPYCNMDVHENGEKAILNGSSIEGGRFQLKRVDEGHTNEKNSDEVGYTPPPPPGGT